MISKVQQEFLVGAVVGGVVGAVTALAFTPLSGAALRKQVASGMHLFNGNGTEKKRTSSSRAHSSSKQAHSTHDNAKIVVAPRAKSVKKGSKSKSNASHSGSQGQKS